MDNGESSYRRYLEGDEAAFDEVVKTLFDKLVFFIERYVGDYHVAEDIAIDSFVELMKHKTRYDFRVSLKTYVFMIGRCRALNYLKHQKRRAAVPLGELEATLADERVSDAFLKRERDRLLHEAIADLPEDMRAAIHLTYFEGLTYDEVARVMKKNKKQVDNLLYRAKTMLRHTLEKEEVLTL